MSESPNGYGPFVPTRELETPAAEQASGIGGQVLAGVVRGLAAVRPAGKPLHPRGAVHRGRLVRTGLPTPTGASWLDAPGEDEVLVRWSRAIGLPAPLPDIHGLALRVLSADGTPGDLLMATTGWLPPTRLLLVPGFGSQRPMTTLLPYSTPTGPVVLGACPGETSTTLYAACLRGPWHPFAELHETPGDESDEPVSFDPVLHPLPDLAFPSWVRRLREPAYRTARATRDEPDPVEVRSADREYAS